MDQPDHAPRVGEALSGGTVEELARLLGLPLASAAAAERLAAGAGAAAQAVRAVLKHDGGGRLFDREPADYLRLLESLASDSAPADDLVKDFANRGVTPAAADLSNADPLHADFFRKKSTFYDRRRKRRTTFIIVVCNCVGVVSLDEW